MKFLLKTLSALTLLSLSAGALANEMYWGSIYTNLNDDCVFVANSNSKAEIDFAKRECKGFGGFQLYIEGADLRYSPTLEFHNKLVFSHREAAFHDIGSEKIQWVYLSQQEADGNGHIKWIGFIYRLNIASPDGGKDISRLYSVRLNGPKTCFLGESKTNEEALALVKNLSTPCKKM